MNPLRQELRAVWSDSCDILTLGSVTTLRDIVWLRLVPFEEPRQWWG